MILFGLRFDHDADEAEAVGCSFYRATDAYAP